MLRIAIEKKKTTVFIIILRYSLTYSEYNIEVGFWDFIRFDPWQVDNSLSPLEPEPNHRYPLDKTPQKW